MDLKEIKRIQKQAAILFFEHFIGNKNEPNRKYLNKNKIQNF